MKNKLVSIIIINWNGKHWLEKCIPSLYKQDYKNFEIVLVDNASTDGSIEFIKKKYPQIKKIVINEENLGFAEANNRGYKLVTGDYVLFLNNDTEVTEDFLSILVKGLEKSKKTVCLQSRMLLMDKPNKLDSVGAFLTATGFLYHYGISKRWQKKYDRRISFYSAKGACMIFKKEVLDETLVDNEVLDSEYFAYFEETDLCHRIWLAGYEIKFEPNSIIYHKMGGTSNDMKNSFIQFHSFKNRINTYIKNLSLSKLLVILPLHILMTQAFSLTALLQFKFDIFAATQKAIWWNIKNLERTLVKRKYIQSKIRKVSDQDLWPKIYKNPKLIYYIKLMTNLESYVD
ncbi:MAG: glycosyltransferase family 2 protein [Candidatus Pacebacteria bacterium]|jgi:GT2 family glycosyltransferase|nr:glycosyltransferase family 2 protein [Candidatus Paceibacterota bacterium]MBT4004451.1 glycosyltransferase family 2 protein [Candidatus Paceibacterota bacterium]MBT4358563.1 glycosyltransferase family 2 protein [Candidatus Paceibacterota bacterium]MBT4680503.1 glycosyltransferase family 2 protein [Candidatus Paceibacterota bacterium]MBT6898836.1 glycosyltransferase family 2 protein [Candidatus Paceibacterota bacterium]